MAPPSGRSVDAHATSLFSAIAIDDSHMHCLLIFLPVSFSTFATSPSRPDSRSSPLYNSNLTAVAAQINRFEWAVYGLNNGHFMSSISTRNLPFEISLAADPFIRRKLLFKEFAKCNRILPGVKELYDHIRSSGILSVLHG